MPIEAKSAEVMERVGRPIVAMDLDEIRTQQREVDSLKCEIDGYERGIQGIRDSQRQPAASAA